MASAIKKVEKIRQMVRLNQVMQRWRHKSFSHRPDSDCSGSDSGSSRRVPSGFLAVYVGIGPERERHVIPTRFLNLPVFVGLLKKAEEEFGFQCSGGLVLPCEQEFFRQVLRCLERDEGRFGRLGLEEFSNMVSDSCKETTAKGKSHLFTPLLQKTRV